MPHLDPNADDTEIDEILSLMRGFHETLEEGRAISRSDIRKAARTWLAGELKELSVPAPAPVAFAIVGMIDRVAGFAGRWVGEKMLRQGIRCLPTTLLAHEEGKPSKFREVLRNCVKGLQERDQFQKSLEGDAVVSVEVGSLTGQDLRFSAVLRVIGVANKDIAYLRERAKRQDAPVLRLPPPPKNKIYHFLNRTVELTGRDTEVTVLEEFLTADRVFNWTGVFGPGGLGKSRLALELLVRLGAEVPGAASNERDERLAAPDWHVGFLNDQSLDEKSKTNWDEWDPDSPTLIVIDYAARRPRDIARVFRALHGRATGAANTRPLEQPVRLLILERDSAGAWWREIEERAAGEVGDPDTAAPHIHLSAFDESMAESDAADLLVRAVARAGNENRPNLSPEEATSILASLSDRGVPLRPLFLLFTADAVASGEQPLGWDRERLLDFAIARERKQWAAIDGHSDHRAADEHWLAVSTCLDGATLAELRSIPSGGAYDPPNGDQANRVRQMAGAPSGGMGRIPGLQPDIMGEYFALNTLGALAQTCGEWDPVDAVVAAIWQCAQNRDGDEPEESFAVILMRFFFDFHPEGWWVVLEAEELLSQESVPLSTLDRALRALLLGGSIEPTEEAFAILGTLGIGLSRVSVPVAFALYTKLVGDAVRTAALPPKARTALAGFIGNLISDFAKDPELRETALQAYDADLRPLAAVEGSSEELALRWANGAVNLINWIAKDPKLRETALHVYREDLRPLCSAKGAPEELVLRWASGAMNLLIGFAEDSERREIALDVYLNDLRPLGMAEGASSEIVLKWARGAASLVNGFAKDFKFRGTALDIYRDDLRPLGAAEGSAAELVLEWANGAANLIGRLGADPLHRQTALDIYHRDLRPLGAAEERSEEMMLRWANGAVNLINAIVKDPELQDIALDIYHGDLRPLCAVEGAPTELVARWASGVVNLINGFAKDPDRREAALGIYLDDLRPLGTADGAPPEIVSIWVRGALFLIQSLEFDSRSVEEMETFLMREVRTMVEARLDPELSSLLHRGCGVFIPWACDNGRVAAFGLLVVVGTETLTWLEEAAEDAVPTPVIEQWTGHVLEHLAKTDAEFRGAPEVVEALRVLESLRER